VECCLKFLQDRRGNRDARSRRTDANNQERILKHLSTKETATLIPDEDTDDSVESPRHLAYVKKYKRFES
jgi:hypothetical protein